METKTGASLNKNAIEAAQDIYQQIWQKDIALAVIYCSSHYDLNILGPELKRLFGDTPVIGCTTAGEIGTNGIQRNGIVGISLKNGDFQITTSLIPDLNNFTTQQGIDGCKTLVTTLTNNHPNINLHNAFFFTLIDSKSKKEEHILSAINNAGINIPTVGGSAGYDVQHKTSHIYYDGEFLTNVAILTLIHSDIPFTLVKENAYEDTGKQLIITETDETNRTIIEFNGEPSSQIYAAMIGKEVPELDLTTTSNNPLALRFNDDLYIRTIVVRPDDTLHAELPYGCGIEEGMVLRLAKPLDTAISFEKKINEIKANIGDISLIIGFDCAYRHLIYEHQGTTEALSIMMRDNNVFAFHSYGEQYCHLHVNQTFTGVAFGKR